MPLKWRIRPASFERFRELRTLKVPQALLLSKLNTGAGLVRLPSKLENLWITHVHKWTDNSLKIVEALVGWYSSTKTVADTELLTPADDCLSAEGHAQAHFVFWNNGNGVEEVPVQ